MKIVILIIVALIILILIIFFKPREEKNIKDKWNLLLQSKTVIIERENIEILTDYVSSKGGYWEIIGLKKDNNQINMTSYDKSLDNIKSVDVTFYWGNKKFKGEKWIPIEKENIYIFFREK